MIDSTRRSFFRGALALPILGVPIGSSVLVTPPPVINDPLARRYAAFLGLEYAALMQELGVETATLWTPDDKYAAYRVGNPNSAPSRRARGVLHGAHIPMPELYPA